MSHEHEFRWRDSAERGFCECGITASEYIASLRKQLKAAVDVGDYYALSEANADYMAAASPDVVLKLIAEVKRLRGQLAWFHGLAHPENGKQPRCELCREGAEK